MSPGCGWLQVPKARATVDIPAVARRLGFELVCGFLKEGPHPCP